jgi:hypothetical protein
VAGVGSVCADRMSSACQPASQPIYVNKIFAF